MLYNIVVVFAIHWHESAMGVHVIPILKPPATSLPIPSRWLPQCTGSECPVSCIELGRVIYFTYGNIHVSMLLSQINSRQQNRHRCKEQTFGLCGRRRGWGDLREVGVFTTDIWSLLLLLLLPDNCHLPLPSFVPFRSLTTETCLRTSIAVRPQSQNGLGPKWLLFCQKIHAWPSFSGDPLPYLFTLWSQIIKINYKIKTEVNLIKTKIILVIKL